MKRLLLGILALLLVLTWLVLYLQAEPSNWSSTVASACLRAGLVLGALWLAFPQVLQILSRLPVWMMGCLGVGLLAMIRWPKSAVVVVPAMIALWVLRPRPANKPPSPGGGPSAAGSGAKSVTG
ncbi:MAG: hypothetical protein J5I93_14720 [Pirellulaceae bacterium]|nr:hypothetical protein [Pirellulaceae bacterium]